MLGWGGGGTRAACWLPAHLAPPPTAPSQPSLQRAVHLLARAAGWQCWVAKQASEHAAEAAAKQHLLGAGCFGGAWRWQVRGGACHHMMHACIKSNPPATMHACTSAIHPPRVISVVSEQQLDARARVLRAGDGLLGSAHERGISCCNRLCRNGKKFHSERESQSEPKERHSMYPLIYLVRYSYRLKSSYSVVSTGSTPASMSDDKVAAVQLATLHATYSYGSVSL